MEEEEPVIVEARPDVPEPVVRPRSEHTISRRDIDQDALKVLYRLVRSNYTAYLVGGGVRDLLLGRRPKDFDVSTNARPEEIRALFRNCILIGKRFRLAHIRYGEKIIETSTFRCTPAAAADPSDPEADLFQRDDNNFGTPGEDALRRDFTVNGLFYDISTFSVIDYVGGLEDLAARRIRSIGDPNIRFREDPVRMIRAVRFASRLGFTLEAETLEAIKTHGPELAKASPARLLEEITRLFAFSSGTEAVRILHETGLLRTILPETAQGLDSPDSDTNGFWAALRALDEGDTVLPEATPALIFALLMLEPLKLHIGRQWPLDNFPRLRFEKIHEFLQAPSARLRFPRRMLDRICHIFLAQNRFANPNIKAGSIASFVTQESFHEALALAEICHTATGRPHTDLAYWRDLLAERIYDRDDSFRRNRQQNHAPREFAPPEATPEQVQGAGEEQEPQSDMLPRRKLSRSARRRRNRRLHRKLEAQRAAQAAADAPSAPDAPEPAALPPEPQEQPQPAAAAPATNEEAPAPQKPGRRRRAKKTEEAPKNTEPADIAPLTASEFYILPKTETTEKKQPAKRSRRRGKKSQEEPAPSDSARLYALKPGVSRSDVADTPYDWMDEL